MEAGIPDDRRGAVESLRLADVGAGHAACVGYRGYSGLDLREQPEDLFPRPPLWWISGTLSARPCTLSGTDVPDLLNLMPTEEFASPSLPF